MTVPRGDKRSRACRRCGAEPGSPCVTATGIEMPVLTHRGRR